MPNWLSTAFKSSESSRAAANKPVHSPFSSYFNAVYYPNWKVYRQQPPSSLNLGFISHVFYAFAWPNSEGTLSLSDEYADTELSVDGVNGCLGALPKLKDLHPHLKIILSIGGGGQGSSHFPQIAANEYTREIFSRSVRDLVNMYRFDGVDIDWEHPNDPRQGSNYIALLAALRNFLPPPAYILTSALPAGEWVLRNINIGAAATFLDFINLMTYDFSGPWVSRTGYQSQLRTPSHPHSDAARLSCESAVNYVCNHGVPSRKVLLGIPTYGRSFLGASRVGQTYSGTAGEEGTFEYRELPRPGATEGVDTATGSAYCIGGDGGFVTYDNPQTVAMKATFVRQHGLGGMFYWTGTGDATGRRSLVETGYNAMHNL